MYAADIAHVIATSSISQDKATYDDHKAAKVTSHKLCIHMVS